MSKTSSSSKRVLFSSLLGVALVGGIAAGGLAMASASAPAEPTLENGSARFVAPSDGKAGSLTFTADVSDDSGVKGVKVLAWPASSKLDPTEAELRHVDSAVCAKTTDDDTSRCTYTLRVSKAEAEAAEPAQGTWYVSALATAKDGGTTFVPRAATFDVTVTVTH